MITSFEVGAVFRIVNEASPTLTKVLRQVRELNKVLETARLALADLNKANFAPGVATAISETEGLSRAWKNVTASAAEAREAIGIASRASARAALPAAATGVTGGGSGGRGGSHRPGWLGGGRAHISGPALHMPGGGHIRVGGHVGGGVMAGLGAVGYSVYQAAKFDDASFMMANHAGVDFKENRDKFRKVLEDASVETGFGEEEVSKASQQWLRMMADTGGDGGVASMPRMVRLAGIEARRKGTSLEESMSSMTGLAHMLRAYSPEDIEKLGPAFTVLSTRNPMKLPEMERAFGYSVPILHSALGLDPYQIMAMGTVMARSGITSTKGGTWIREMFMGALPGTSVISKTRFHKHEEALKQFGLVDQKGDPTWMTDGKLDPLKFLDITAENWNKIPITKRGAVANAAFGKQGAGALAVLDDAQAVVQTRSMITSMKDPKQLAEVKNFQAAYNDASTVQGARTAMAQFNVLAAEIGTTALPSVNNALGTFRSMLAGITSYLPKSPGGDGAIGGRMIVGATGGAVAGGSYGLFGGPLGVVGGAAVGGTLGAGAGLLEGYSKNRGSAADSAVNQDFIRALRDGGETGAAPGQALLGVAEQYMKNLSTDPAGQRDRVNPGRPYDRPGDRYERRIERLEGAAGGGSGGPAKAVLAPISLSLNLNGEKLGQAMSSIMANMYGFPSQGASFDGAGGWVDGGHQQSDK